VASCGPKGSENPQLTASPALSVRMVG
jgi:hypothetical protein